MNTWFQDFWLNKTLHFILVVFYSYCQDPKCTGRICNGFLPHLGVSCLCWRPDLILCICVTLDQAGEERSMWKNSFERLCQSFPTARRTTFKLTPLALVLCDLCCRYMCAWPHTFLIFWPDFLVDLGRHYGLVWWTWLLAEPGYCHWTCSALHDWVLWACASC